MITILGAGLAGLSAAVHLKQPYTVLEKEAEPGGLCRSVKTRGYTFDYAPHIFFSGSEYVNGLVSGLLAGNVARQQRRAFIHVYGEYVEYPFEVNLHGLSREVIEECIAGVESRRDHGSANFRDWILSNFGEGIARHYMVPYNEKIWKYPLEKMNTDWIAGRVPAPSVEEMRRGAGGKVQRDYGPNAYFSYPVTGGIGAIPGALAGRAQNIRTGADVEELRFTPGGVEVAYTHAGERKTIESERVLSSLPLPDLVEMIPDAPSDVAAAARRLVYNSLICMDVGVDRSPVSDKHWLYFPEKKYPFNRISIQSNFSERTAPAGKSSILVEVTSPKGARVDVEDTKHRVREGLEEAGILRGGDRLEVFDAHWFKYSYVVYDLDHKRNVKVVHDYLREHRVIPIGRFGEWEYFNMDKAILSGKSAAEKLG